MPAYASRPRHAVLGALAIASVGIVVFWRTAYPTITWWDSSSYSLAAATLGINSPPGSLLLTLIGWPVAHLPIGHSPAHLLNLFAGALAACSATLVFIVAVRLLRVGRAPNDQGSGWLAAGAACGALTLAFGTTMWSYATKFTPYILTTVFTGFILWTMVRWWMAADDAEAWRWIALLGLLFGLDFSVHRTNALLIPGAIVWILLRRPRTLRSGDAIAAGVGGLVAGLAFHFLLIPIAAYSGSAFNFSDPSNLSRFWDYVTIKQLGGSFLLQLFPRKSPPWSAQSADVLHVLSANFFHPAGSVRVLGVLPTLFAAAGVVVLWRRNRRLSVAYVTVVVLQAAFTVLYFNIPANFFREFDRHYLPICVSLAVLVSCGMAGLLELAAALPTTHRRLALTAAAMVVAATPVTQVFANWSSHDASREYFARDYAWNVLQGLPPKAIYFTVGDNDTFPVMYLQSVEGVRPDVTIINQSVANIPRWPEQLRRRDPALPMSLSMDERMRLASRNWGDTTIALPVRGDAAQLAMPAGAPLPSSIDVKVQPAYGERMIPSDVLVLDIAQTNAWRRPLAFAVSGTKGAMGSLGAFGRLDGWYYRVVPQRDPPPDVPLLRHWLLAGSKYRGYADPTIALDADTRRMGVMPYAGLVDLLAADTKAGDLSQCRADREALLMQVPLDRTQPPGEMRDAIESACAPRVAPH